ncbi:MAG: hypothetical protein NT105_03330 [Verrucomicrobia bacterium]|nr:hypothetical protein [Verrucomicrobiota bacterium]
MLEAILLILLVLMLLGALQIWLGDSSGCLGLEGNMPGAVKTITVLPSGAATSTISAIAIIAAGKTLAQLERKDAHASNEKHRRPAL